MLLTTAVFIGAIAALIQREWVIFAALGGLFLALSLLPALVMTRVAPDRVARFTRANEKFAMAWARAMGRASGGFDPPRKRKR